MARSDSLGNEMGCLYLYEFNNSKQYIGITMRDLKMRHCEHMNTSLKNPQLPFHKALSKYGDNYVLRILVISNNWEYLQLLERRAIISYNTIHPYGYNLTEGGEGTSGYVWSNESRQKLSTSASNRSHEYRQKMSEIKRNISDETRQKMKDHKHSLETRLKISNSNKGKILSESTKLKISNSLKGNQVSENTRMKLSESRKGKSHSEESRLKISDFRRTFKHSEESKLKISESLKGRKQSPESIAKMLATRKANRLKNES